VRWFEKRTECRRRANAARADEERSAQYGNGGDETENAEWQGVAGERIPILRERWRRGQSESLDRSASSE
jgi:hypothetical protein